MQTRRPSDVFQTLPRRRAPLGGARRIRVGSPRAPRPPRRRLSRPRRACVRARRYGYEIIKELEERVGGGYSPSPGVVYPTLTLLEEVGHATVSDEAGGRRLYTLSAEGLAFLEANRTQVDAILARIAEASASRRGPSPSVLRAMENLGSALRHRLRGRPASDDHIRVIVAAIDAAAKAVEES
jgi:DNA-binding PadR family transcriptional regulator